MRAGKFILTHELLERLLKLPKGNYISSIQQSEAERLHAIFEVIVIGEDCPKVIEGNEIPIIDKL